jgi:hypothetical protein
MMNLNATPGWDPVPQIETVTALRGGAGGPLNQPAQALLNRTEYLRTAVGAALQKLSAKGIALSGATQPVALSPRLPGPGTGIMTVGIVLSANSYENSPGIVGSLAGGLSLSFDSVGRIKVSKTSTADLAISNIAVSAGTPVLVLYSRDGLNNHAVSVNGTVVLEFNSAVGFTGDLAYIGSSDGINAVLDGSVGLAFVSTEVVPANEAASILAHDLSEARIRKCVFSTGDSHQCDPLVVPSAASVGYDLGYPIQPTLVLPPEGASIRNYPARRPGAAPCTPRVGAAYFIGDSQTFGFNASASAIYTDTAETRLKAQYRWPDKYASQGNRDIQVHNFAVTGSGIAYIPGQPASNSPAWNPHLHAMGLIPKDWTGQVVLVPGWNNIGGGAPLSFDALTNLRRGIEALIARALCVDYGGMGVNGLYSDYGIAGPIAGWSTTGSADDQTTAGLTYKSNPFPAVGASDNSVIRKVKLAPGEYVEFDVLAIGSNGRYALFTEATQDGGPFAVLQNGVVIINDTTLTSQPGNWPQVNWIENPAPGQKLRVQNTGADTQTVRFLAAGWVVSDTGAQADRTVIACTTTGNLTGRLPSNVQAAAKQALHAAMTFGDMGVLFCNFAAGWQPGDLDAQDPAHISPQGNARLAETLPQAVPVAHVLPTWCVHL